MTLHKGQPVPGNPNAPRRAEHERAGGTGERDTDRGGHRKVGHAAGPTTDGIRHEARGTTTDHQARASGPTTDGLRHEAHGTATDHIRYEVVDMFADRPLTGCALGVVPDASGLSDEDLAAVAAELNTSETAFVLPATAPGATHRVRVFTPTGESPFGGHSAIGTAATLVRLGVLPAGRVVQECGPKLQPVDATADGGTLSATNPLDSEEFDPTGLARACGLPADLPSATAAGFGPAFHFLPVCPDALADARLHADDPVWADRTDLFAFTWDPDTRTARARMFAPGYRMPEDPACASAGLGLGVWLVSAGLLTDDGTHRFTVHQGVELGRPSTLDCTVTVEGGRAVAGSVSGVVRPALDGRIALS
ncbi:PhzF family phenazine biosynthesis protein [Actinosynnema sp. NPDC020468]|uniref:PhzF family phenazine biosynthesis protein n=1 Tax=Actinosynnema sp. NPDC020468 TaxID=3154488 RepID=UPI0033FC2656